MRNFEAYLDEHGGYVAGKSSVIVVPHNDSLSLLTCLGLLNSRLIRFFLQESYGALGIDGGISFSGDIVESLPLPNGFSGRIPQLETKVMELLSKMSHGEDVSRHLYEIDMEIFDAYDLPEAARKVILECELKC